MTSVALGYSLLAVILFLFALAWWSIAKFNPAENRGCIYATGYSSLWGMGILLISFRGLTSAWLTHTLSSFCFVAGFVCLVRSVDAVYNLPSTRRLALLLLAVSALLLILAGPGSEGNRMRLLVLGGVSVFCIVHAMLRSFKPVAREHGVGAVWFVGAIGAVATVLWFVRLKLAGSTGNQFYLVADSAFSIYAMYLIWAVAVCFQAGMLFLLIVRNAKQLERLTSVDYLTGAYNRLGMDKGWGDIRSVYDRVAVLVIDVDHFKRINDTYGHAAGDEVLKLMVSRTQRVIRDTDLMSRYGGEEFVVLVPGFDHEQAVQLAERIRQGIEQNPFKVSGVEISVTASIGVMSDTVAAAEVEALIKVADQALYHAKELGRNRVVLAQG